MPSLSRIYPTAFVTGASGGLGGAFVDMLLAEGVRVWGTARDPARLESRRGTERFTPIALDLADTDRLRESWREASSAAGGCALLINNAGYGHFGEFATEPFEIWERQVRTMLTGTMALTQVALAEMRARGSGAIVNVSSLAAEFPLPYMGAYNVAKAGLSAFSESLMIETAGTGLTVIDFRPGDYRTGFNQAMPSRPPTSDAQPRLVRAWQALETNLRTAPSPCCAATDLRRALISSRSGVVRSGSFFQARLAPFLARLAPLAWRRSVAARYFGVA